MGEDIALGGAQLLFQDVVPGFSLYRATQDVNKWKKGGLGLVDSDGLCMIWYDEPIPEPELLPDEEGQLVVVEATTKKELTQADLAFFDWLAAAQNFGSGWIHSDVALDGHLIPDIRRSWSLMQACMRVGYRPDQDGYIWYWLFDRMGWQLAKMPLNDNPRSRAYMFWAENGGSKIHFHREDEPSANDINIYEHTTYALNLNVDGHLWEIFVRPKKDETDETKESVKNPA